MSYFKEFKDEQYPQSAVKDLNRYLEETGHSVISIKYHVVRYEQQNLDRTYILAELECE